MFREFHKNLSLQYYVMSQNLCACHCGTRITIDQQLLQQREMWREKYNCLQRQAVNDLGKLKENMYLECAAIMQKQFAAKEQELTLLANDKNNEIKTLTTRVINLQAALKIKTKENQILAAKTRELEQALTERDNNVQALRSKTSKNDREWQARLQEELTALRKRLAQQYQGEIRQKDAENDHIRHKVAEYQKRFQMTIPQVEKLKNNLEAKNQQVRQLQAKLDKLKKEAQTQLLRTQQEMEQAAKSHSGCRARITKLQLQVESLTSQLENARRVKRQVRIEPVYLQRAVQVPKVVEKIVEVQKVVNKYIEPTTFRDEQLQSQLQKLKQQNAHLLNELHLSEERHIIRAKEYDQILKQYEQNEGKYKREREELAKRILDQQREIDTIHAFIERKRSEALARGNQPQKITIHVSKDGKYQKTVQRVASTSGIATGQNLKSRKK